jgi:hypothetical protein
MFAKKVRKYYKLSESRGGEGREGGELSFQCLRQKGPLFCHAMGIILHKISSLYAPSEIASQFPPPLRSNNCELPVDIIIAMWF